MSLLLLAIAALALWPTALALHELWTAPETAYGHGYALAAIAAWLLWKASRTSRGLPSRPAPSAFVLLAAGGLGWCLAQLAGLQVIAIALWPLLLWLAVAAGSGYAVARAHAFPLALMLLATPLPTLTNGFFQWATVHAVRALLRLCGIPVYFEGNTVEIPAGTFEIAGGCSGLRYVIIGVIVAALVGELRQENARRRLSLLALATGLVMIGNWLRVLGIILIGHFSYMQHPVVEDHNLFGWLVFGAAVAAFVLLDRLLLKQPAAVAAAVSTRAAPLPGAPARLRPVPALTITLFVFGAIAALHLLASRPVQASVDALRLPSGWSVDPVAATPWRPRFEGADIERLETYRGGDGRELQIYQAAYTMQRQGKEFRGYLNDPFGGVREEVVPGSGTDGAPIVRTRGGDGRVFAVVAEYRVGSRSFASPTLAQLYFALMSLGRLEAAPSRVVVYRAGCAADCSAAHASIRDFIALN